jgi:hypothetical protein
MSHDEAFLERLLTALEQVGLEALIVGSTAAVLQGAPVMTQDIDLLVRDTPLVRRKLEKLGAALHAARPAAVSELSSALTILGAELPVDILFESLPGGLHFASLKSRAMKIAVGSKAALAASLADVIASKEAAGRPKDLAQLPILRQTLQVIRAMGRDPK